MLNREKKEDGLKGLIEGWAGCLLISPGEKELTVQATGIAALHTCFMRGNPPYYTQIPREKHTCKKIHLKIHEKMHAN